MHRKLRNKGLKENQYRKLCQLLLAETINQIIGAKAPTEDN